jgi:hypothetical protein
MSETPLASVFSGGRYVGAILHRGPKGYEAVADDGASHGCYPSQREAASTLQANFAGRATLPGACFMLK